MSIRAREWVWQHSKAEGSCLTGPPMLAWAQRLIAAGGPSIPEYGTPARHALPDNDRRKVAACVIAAESWRTYTDPAEVALRLRLELDALRAEQEEATWTPEIVAAVHRTAHQPTHAELCDRRREPDRAERARWHEQRITRLSPIGPHPTSGGAS